MEALMVKCDLWDFVTGGGEKLHYISRTLVQAGVDRRDLRGRPL